MTRVIIRARANLQIMLTSSHEGQRPYAPSQLNQIAWKIFTKKYGLVLQVDTLDYLRSILRPDQTIDEVKEALDHIAKAYQTQHSSLNQSTGMDLLITVSGLRKVLENSERLVRPATLHDEIVVPAKNFIQIVNAAECPRWDFDGPSRHFVRAEREREKTGARLLADKAECLSDMYRRHFEITKHRVLRAFGFSSQSNVKLTCLLMSLIEIVHNN